MCIQRPLRAGRTVLEEKKAESTGLDEKLIKTRSIMICGEISEETSERVAKQLLILEAEGDGPITVFLDSPGGDVNAGYAIFDMLRFVSCPVTMVGMGLVASAAALILLAADKEHRVGLPGSEYLIHQPSSQMRGVASDIEIHARQLEKLKEKINAEIAAQTGKSIEDVRRDTDRDCWMDSAQAVEYGLISKVVRNRSEL
ncbi:MAG: ATP-dependent Clp protease proteolytic subunit [Spirochaetales bacterium]|nr:ATP-dependent Clp protease proteolytic subunit [Spirochaetales bacterium]